MLKTRHTSITLHACHMYRPKVFIRSDWVV